jgi:hypothetical protein
MFHQVDLLLFVQLQKYNFTVDDNTFIINFKCLKTNYPATKHFLNISQSIMSYLVEKLATLNDTDFIFQINKSNINRDGYLDLAKLKEIQERCHGCKNAGAYKKYIYHWHNNMYNAKSFIFILG